MSLCTLNGRLLIDHLKNFLTTFVLFTNKEMPGSSDDNFYTFNHFKLNSLLFDGEVLAVAKWCQSIISSPLIKHFKYTNPCGSRD